MKPAAIQYAGLPGISLESLQAILRFIQFGDTITKARLLTAAEGREVSHCFLLEVSGSDLVAVRSGFSSGYAGEGPRTLSRALAVLDAFGVEVDEYDVDIQIIEMIDAGTLSASALQKIDKLRPVRPPRLYDYREHWDPICQQNDRLLNDFRPVIPYYLVDAQLMDLAIGFWDSPDERLMTGFKRLEDKLRRRAAVQEVGTQLVTAAFRRNPPKLVWPDLLDTEREGRIELFFAAFKAYRNPRAHNERQSTTEKLLWEFLLINQLFKYETEAQASEGASNKQP